MPEFTERVLKKMQYVFELSFTLQAPSPQLNNFANVDKANIVFPSQTHGGNICSGMKEPKRLTVNIPLLKQKATFYVENSAGEIQRNVAIYNLACSLGSCFFLHHVYEDDETKKQKLIVSITTECKADHELFLATDRRFLTT